MFAELLIKILIPIGPKVAKYQESGTLKRLLTEWVVASSQSVVLQMSAKQTNGNLTRMTYIQDANNDNVTQTMEGSSDEGRTWTTNFVGVYKKVLGKI